MKNELKELLITQQEVELIKQIQRGEGDVVSAKEKLMRSNFPFVRAIARRYVMEKHPLDELIAEGNKGLEAAIYKYDETRGFKFFAYATWWIRQSIDQHIKNHSTK